MRISIRLSSKAVRPFIRLSVVLFLFALIVPLATLQAREGKLAERWEKSMTQSVKELADKGREQEAFELIEVMRNMGASPRELEKLRGYCVKKREKVKKKAKSLPSTAQDIHNAARGLTAQLEHLDGEEAFAWARQILRLDSEIKPAIQVLEGKSDDRAEKKLKRRRMLISEMMRRARRLEIPIEVESSDHLMLDGVLDRKGWKIRSNYLEVHTPLSRDKGARIVTETLRALALSSFLVRGKLEVPSLKGTWIMLDSKEAYEQAVEEAMVNDGLTPKEGDYALQVMSYIDRRGYGVFHSRFEAFAEAQFLCCLDPNTFFSQACLRAGHLGWICFSFLGVPLPDASWIEYRKQGDSLQMFPYDPIASGLKLLIERSEMMRRSRAGLAGCRSWLTYLAYRDEDPKWTSSMTKEMGQIRDNNLLKCVMVVQYLQELGPLQSLIRDTAPNLAANVGRPADEIFAEALQMPMDEFERQWREWLLPETEGLAQRLAVPVAEELTREDKHVVDAINEVRKEGIGCAVKPPVTNQTSGSESAGGSKRADEYKVYIDPELSKGARLHADYLKMNPHQITVWPDAHEEYPDCEGFTARGSWAGAYSLISNEGQSISDALDAWLGSFYHRIPLLHPGLLCVGWARDGSLAVLDAGSFVVPIQEPWAVKWPHDGMKGVPLSFVPEVPNPVPEVENLELLGYPITLQLWRPVLHNEVWMKLYKGKIDLGEEVPCYYTSPSRPLNTALVPEHAYCLIPESRLEPSTLYTVRAESLVTEEIFTWSFKTGRH